MESVVKAYRAAAYYFAISVFVAVSFLLNCLCFLIGLLPGTRVLKNPLRCMLQFLFIHWARFVGFIGVLRLSCPPRTQWKREKGEIWVMNHPSILDGSYLLKFIANGTCVYKHQIGSNPLYGSVAKLAGHIPNVGGPDMVRMACEALGRGEDLVIFPEGTRTTFLDLEKFKPGFALIAKRSGAAVNVLWMDGPADFMTREMPFWKMPDLPAEVAISRIGRLEGCGRMSVPELLSRVNAIYEERLGA